MQINNLKMEDLRNELIKQAKLKLKKVKNNPEEDIKYCSRFILELNKIKNIVELRLNNWSSEEKLKKINENFLSEIEKIKDKNLKYLEKKIIKLLPESSKIAEPIILARLIDKVGSVESLAKMPSSRIQIFGAEKALFKHLKHGSKMPKYGIIYSDKRVLNAENKAKAARKLASEISKKIKIDYFRK